MKPKNPILSIAQIIAVGLKTRFKDKAATVWLTIPKAGRIRI